MTLMQPLLTVRHVSKAFGHVQALIDVDLDINPGEVLGLLGDNGAGKSTLIKILSGVYFADEGEFTRDGDLASIGDPNDAQALGIATVYQDLSLVENRPVAHNIYLGREPRRWRILLHRRKMEKDAEELLERLNITLPGSIEFCWALVVEAAAALVVDDAGVLGLGDGDEAEVGAAWEPPATLGGSGSRSGRVGTASAGRRTTPVGRSGRRGGASSPIRTRSRRSGCGAGAPGRCRGPR